MSVIVWFIWGKGKIACGIITMVDKKRKVTECIYLEEEKSYE